DFDLGFHPDQAFARRPQAEVRCRGQRRLLPEELVALGLPGKQTAGLLPKPLKPTAVRRQRGLTVLAEERAQFTEEPRKPRRGVRNAGEVVVVDARVNSSRHGVAPSAGLSSRGHGMEQPGPGWATCGPTGSRVPP